MAQYPTYPAYTPNLSPQQYTEEFNRLMQNYNSLYNQKQQMTPQYTASNTVPQPAQPQGGDWKYVSSLEEVENMPTRVDGTATLLVDFTNNVFWSKKFSNGQHIIQAYKFMPLNANTEKPVENTQESTPKIPEDILNKLTTKIDELETKLNSLGTKTKNKKEEPVDEL